MASSDSKVVYYKVCRHALANQQSQPLTASDSAQDVLSGQTVLSSKDEIKEVGKVFWEVKAKRKTIGSAWEGDAEFDLAKEFDLKSVGEVRQATLQSYLSKSSPSNQRTNKVSKKDGTPSCTLQGRVMLTFSF